MNIRPFIVLSIGMIIAGICYSLYMHEIVILWPRLSQSPVRTVQSSQAVSTTIFYLKEGKWQQCSHDILWDNNKPRYIQLLQNTVDTLHQEHVITKPVKIEYAQTNASGGILYVQCDRSPLQGIDAIKKKIAVIDSILRTVAATQSGVHALQFLVQHQPMVDPHIDFTQPLIVSILSIRSCY